jgi:multiple sugar transport system substrate-binding protein
MKYAFGGILALVVASYVIALGTLRLPKDEGVVRLRWATDINPAREVQTKRFAEMYPGIEVTVDPGLGGDQTKLIVQCATGTGPDVIDCGQEGMATLVQAGVLLDLTPYASKMGFGLDKTYPALADGLMVEGKQYRFPCNVWANCIVYNKAIFDDHGVPYPKDDWTWDDFIETCRRLKESPSKSGEEHVNFANWNSEWFYGELLSGNGGRRFTEDGLTSMLDSREAIRAMQFYHDLMHKYRVIPTSSQLANISSQGGWGSGGLTLFSVGKAAMMIIGRWYLCQVPHYPDIKGKLGAVRLPHVSGRPMTGMIDARAAGVNAMSPHREAALNFLQYLASPEYSKLIVDDGDSMPPNPLLARTGADLVNSAEPDPAFHQPFVDAIRDAHPCDISPFIDAQLVQRWLNETIDKVENQVEEPQAAMESLANEINHLIRLDLERQPHLQRKYRHITGRDYTPDWWRKYQRH